mgnify:CR=1 FL=1
MRGQRRRHAWGGSDVECIYNDCKKKMEESLLKNDESKKLEVWE